MVFVGHDSTEGQVASICRYQCSIRTELLFCDFSALQKLYQARRSHTAEVVLDQVEIADGKSYQDILFFEFWYIDSLS